MQQVEQSQQSNSPELGGETPPYFDIPGFDTLDAERQQLYKQIPANMLDDARPLILADIEKTREKKDEKADGQSEVGDGTREKANAEARITKASKAAKTWHAAQRGDPDALKDLQDFRQEVLGDEIDDDTLWQAVLVTEGTGIFDSDKTTRDPLDELEAEEVQRVFDLFQEYRGALPSVDDAISPELQLKLFREVTKGNGTIAARHAFMREVLDLLTAQKSQDLDVGLKAYNVVPNGRLYKEAVSDLCRLAEKTRLLGASSS